MKLTITKPQQVMQLPHKFYIIESMIPFMTLPSSKLYITSLEKFLMFDAQMTDLILMNDSELKPVLSTLAT